MSTFDLHLLSPRANERISNVAAYEGEDSSGRFALRAHHECFITALIPGLSCLRYDDGRIEYLAQPGGVLYFSGNALTLAMRDYLRSEDLHTVSRALEERFAREEASLGELHEQLRQLEREMLRRLWRLQRETVR